MLRYKTEQHQNKQKRKCIRRNHLGFKRAWSHTYFPDRQISRLIPSGNYIAYHPIDKTMTSRIAIVIKLGGSALVCYIHEHHILYGYNRLCIYAPFLATFLNITDCMDITTCVHITLRPGLTGMQFVVRLGGSTLNPNMWEKREEEEE